MKLGTETGSVTNHIYSRSVIGMPTPEVGMGATVLHWTDRSAATIVRVFKIGQDMAIEIQGDRVTRTDQNGQSEMQSYDYAANPTGTKSTYRFGKGKRWKQVKMNSLTKRWNNVEGGGGLIIGVRDEYYDPCF